MEPSCGAQKKVATLNELNGWTVERLNQPTSHISQIGSSSPTKVKNKRMFWNHQPVRYGDKLKKWVVDGYIGGWWFAGRWLGASENIVINCYPPWN